MESHAEGVDFSFSPRLTSSAAAVCAAEDMHPQRGRTEPRRPDLIRAVFLTIYRKSPQKMDKKVKKEVAFSGGM